MQIDRRSWYNDEAKMMVEDLKTKIKNIEDMVHKSNAPVTVGIEDFVGVLVRMDRLAHEFDHEETRERLEAMEYAYDFEHGR